MFKLFGADAITELFDTLVHKHTADSCDLFNASVNVILL